MLFSGERKEEDLSRPRYALFRREGGRRTSLGFVISLIRREEDLSRPRYLS